MVGEFGGVGVGGTAGADHNSSSRVEVIGVCRSEGSCAASDYLYHYVSSSRG